MPSSEPRDTDRDAASRPDPYRGVRPFGRDRVHLVLSRPRRGRHLLASRGRDSKRRLEGLRRSPSGFERRRSDSMRRDGDRERSGRSMAFRRPRAKLDEDLPGVRQHFPGALRHRRGQRHASILLRFDRPDGTMDKDRHRELVPRRDRHKPDQRAEHGRHSCNPDGNELQQQLPDRQRRRLPRFYARSHLRRHGGFGDLGQRDFGPGLFSGSPSGNGFRQGQKPRHEAQRGGDGLHLQLRLRDSDGHGEQSRRRRGALRRQRGDRRMERSFRLGGRRDGDKDL